MTQARENACSQVKIGFGFYFLLVEVDGRDILPITERTRVR